MRVGRERGKGRERRRSGGAGEREKRRGRRRRKRNKRDNESPKQGRQASEVLGFLSTTNLSGRDLYSYLGGVWDPPD